MSHIMIAPATPDDLPAIAALLGQAEDHDGVGAVGEVGLLALAAGRAGEFLTAREAAPGDVTDASPSAIAGAAWTDGRSAELAVAPAARRRGVGTALVEAIVPSGARIWAHGPVPHEFIEAVGLLPVRELLHLRWEAGSVVVPPVPDGITVRTFTEADGPAWVALNASVFADHPEQGRLTERDLAERTASAWFDADLFWLAEDSRGTLIGYSWVKPGEDEDELYVIGLAEEARGKGLAAHLVGRAQEAASRRGVSGLGLYVDAVNRTAVRSYERAGFLPDGVDLQFVPTKERHPHD